MRGGLVLTFVVLVTGVVRIDEMNVVDAPGQLPNELNLAGEGLFLSFLASAYDTNHLPVTGVVHHTKVQPVDGVVDTKHVARLVEGEAGLELPCDVLTVVGRDVA